MEQKPIDYQSNGGGDPTGSNFALGLLGGICASAIIWGITFGTKGAGGMGLFLVAGLGVCKIVVAAVSRTSRRWKGLAAGVLTSLGLATLVGAGLCFYAVQHI